MSVFDARRRVMVESQLRTNKVTDQRVIHAFESIRREAFLPGWLRGLAYIDEDLFITSKGDHNHTSGRFMLEAMVFARLVQALALTDTAHVLHIAANCGYGTAILAQLCQSVVGVEEDAGLAELAAHNLIAQGVDNGVVVHASHADGYPKEAPYDAIVIEGGVADIPPKILAQLAKPPHKQGRLVSVLRETLASPGKAVMVEASATGAMARHILFDAQTPILPAFAQKPEFTFA